MLRLITFAIGLAFFAAGFGSGRGINPMPFDLSAMSFGIGFASTSMDVIVMVVGVFFMVIATIFHKLFSGTV